MSRIPLSFLAAAVLALSLLAGCGDKGLYEEAVSKVIALADEAVASNTDVPVPADAVGGLSHDVIARHRQYVAACGTAYRITSDRKYADWVSDLLSGYAAIYPTLPYHPEGWRTAEPGRLCWQVLEDSMWIFYVAGGYMEVRDAVSPQRRDIIETRLLRPAADFLMYGTEDNRKNNFVFNRMHNHGTWQDAAVGAVGLAVGDRDYVMRSLYGTDLTGEHGGLLQQIDCLFSPDGYYMEGVVYQSYALIPFLQYGMMLRERLPELDYLERNDGVLARSAEAMFSLAYAQDFFRLNDAGVKTFRSSDMAFVIPYLYYLDPSRKWLLSIVRDFTGKVMPDEAGRLVSRDLADGKAEPFVPSSRCITDGPDGEKGATMVLRTCGQDAPTVYMKACGQGSYHGHFDKLTIGYFDNGREILTEYGSARFNGIGPRNAGHYTPLNRGYAMTTVAHNTLVADCRSHYEGVTPYGLPHSPKVLAFKGDGSDFQYMAAMDSTAYSDVRMERWIAMVSVPFLESPMIADILIASGASPHRYDYPVHYSGQMIETNVPYVRSTENEHPLGEDYGYQHLWVEAEGDGHPSTTTYTWLCGDRFYSMSTATTTGSTVMHLRTGANDPDFYLRSEPVYMIREDGLCRHVFASCLESHGRYCEADERCVDPSARCAAVEVAESGDELTVRYSFMGGNTVELTIGGGRMSCRYQ